MQITIKLFATLRDRAGSGSLTLDLPPMLRGRAVLRELSRVRHARAEAARPAEAVLQNGRVEPD